MRPEHLRCQLAHDPFEQGGSLGSGIADSRAGHPDVQAGRWSTSRRGRSAFRERQIGARRGASAVAEGLVDGFTDCTPGPKKKSGAAGSAAS
jgi:hypothetical protein